MTEEWQRAHLKATKTPSMGRGRKAPPGGPLGEPSPATPDTGLQSSDGERIHSYWCRAHSLWYFVTAAPQLGRGRAGIQTRALALGPMGTTRPAGPPPTDRLTVPTRKQGPKRRELAKAGAAPGSDPHLLAAHPRPSF